MYGQGKSVKWCVTVALIVIIPSFAIVRAQEPPSPYFESGIIELPAFVELSPQGSFVADFRIRGGEYPNIGLREGECGEVIVELWETHAFTRDETVIRPSPVANNSLEYCKAGDWWSFVAKAFSPDERYLAILKDFNLTILTVPELEIHQIIPLPAETTILEEDLQWSNDSRLIAINVDRLKLVVWDVYSQEFHEHDIDHHGPIFASDEGWLLTWYFEEDASFAACTRLVEECTFYGLQDLPVAGGEPGTITVTPDREMVLVYWEESSGEAATWVWRLQDNGSYQLDPQPLTELGSDRIYSFSPDGQFIVTYNSDFERQWARLTIRRSDTFEIVQSIDDWCELIFFPMHSEYFITHCSDILVLNLFHVGQDKPVSTIDVDNLLEFTPFDQVDFTQPVVNERYVWEPIMLDISLDGKWVTLHFGSGDALIPIVLE